MAELTGALSAEKIMKEIAGYVSKDVSAIEALTYYADKHDIEVELLGDLVRRSPTLKAFVRKDAERLLLVEVDDEPRLPI